MGILLRILELSTILMVILLTIFTIFYWRTRMLGIFSKCKDVKAIMVFETMVFIAFLAAAFAAGIAIF